MKKKEELNLDTMTVEEMKEKMKELQLRIAELKVKSDRLNAGVLITIGISFVLYNLGYAIQNGYVVLGALALLLGVAVPGFTRINMDDEIEKGEKLVKEMDRRVKIAFGVRPEDLAYLEDEEEDEKLKAR